jgi:hypothetical protein
MAKMARRQHSRQNRWARRKKLKYKFILNLLRAERKGRKYAV